MPMTTDTKNWKDTFTYVGKERVRADSDFLHFDSTIRENNPISEYCFLCDNPIESMSPHAKPSDLNTFSALDKVLVEDLLDDPEFDYLKIYFVDNCDLNSTIENITINRNSLKVYRSDFHKKSKNQVHKLYTMTLQEVIRERTKFYLRYQVPEYDSFVLRVVSVSIHTKPSK
jgi:hypothetical protein